MNKTIKVILITGCSILLAGLILATCGWIMLGSRAVTFYNETFHTDHPDIVIDGENGSGSSSGSGRGEVRRVTDGDLAPRSYELTDAYSSISLHSGIARVYILPSTDGVTRLETENMLESDIRFEVKGNKLYVQERGEYDHFDMINVGPIHIGRDGLSIGATFDLEMVMRLYLPAQQYNKVEMSFGVGESFVQTDITAGELSMELGVGNCVIESKLTAEDAEFSGGVGRFEASDCVFDELALKSGVGEFDLNGLTVSGELSVYGGMGNIRLDNATLHDSEFKMGVGSLYVDGVLLGTNRITQGVGDVTLNIHDSLDNYFLRLDAGPGSMVLSENGSVTERYNTLARSTDFGSSDAPNRIRVEGGVGDLRLDFMD